MKRPGAELPAASIVYLLKQLELAVRHRLDDVLDGLGVTTAQYTMLTSIRRRPDITGAELARRWHITPQSTSEVLSGLERLGLIERRPSPAHRRHLTMTITERGAKLLADCDRKIAWLDEQLLVNIPPESREQFRADLIDARRALEQSPWPEAPA